ncbi:MAG: DUF1015 domain-containing protein [Saprospiraceae bacterium]
MNIIPFQGLLPNLSQIPDTDRFFDTVKEDYRNYYEQACFLPSPKAAFYVMRITNEDHRATGLVCTTSVEDYLSGRVMKHEKIIHHKEQIQIDLLDERKAVVKPILLLHQKVRLISNWLEAYTQEHSPVLELTFSDGECHQVWDVSDAAHMATLQSLFLEKIPLVAIADGHHRFSSFATLQQEQHEQSEKERFSAVLTAYFPEDELSIDAFNRLVELPRPFNDLQFLEALEAIGKLHPLPSPGLPGEKHHLSICLSSGWYDFSWSPEILQAEDLQHPLLDVNLLNQFILHPLLEVDDVQTSTRMHYLEGNGGIPLMEKALLSYASAIGFALYPIHTHDFLEVVTKELTLVPKATFFQPRLKNGMIVQQV